MTNELVWYLTSGDGSRHRLPHEMLFVGRQACELILKSHSIDKQHAVLNYDSVQDAFRIKDLGTLNGTFVNDTRLPEQVYITMKDGDLIKFGYDPQTFTIAKLIRVVNNDNGSLLVKRKGNSSSTSLTSSSSSSSTSAEKSESRVSKSTCSEVPSQKENAKANGQPEEIDSTPTKREPGPASSSKGSPHRSPTGTSFTVDMSSKNPTANGERDLQHYASLRAAKKNTAIVEKKEALTSVDQWFSLNQPNRREKHSQLNEESIEASGDGDTKRNSTASRSTTGKPCEPVPSLSPRKSKQGSIGAAKSRSSSLSKPTIASAMKIQTSIREMETLKHTSGRSTTHSRTSNFSKLFVEKISLQSTKNSATDSSSSSSSSSTSSSSSQSDVSESGTYTIKNEKSKDNNMNGNTAIDGLQQIGGATADASALRSSWVNEWVNQHQITSELIELNGNEDRMSRSGSEGQRVRRSLPSIPSSIKSTQNVTLGDECEQKIPSVDNDCQPEAAIADLNFDAKREQSPKTSYQDLAATLQSLQDKFKSRSTSFEPPLVDIAVPTNMMKESTGNNRPSRSRRPLSARSTSRKSSSSSSTSSSRDSSTEPSLIRSNSFTKIKPSGVVPLSQLPDATETPRLCRSNSFTKVSPGLPEELIPHISSESSSSSIDADASIDTSLLMKDTEKVISVLKKLPRNSIDESSTVSVTEGETGDRWSRPSPRRIMSDRLKSQQPKETSIRPKTSRNSPMANKSTKTSLRLVERLSCSALSSDSECVRTGNGKRSVGRGPRLRGTNSDAESPTLKLTRTTLLRQNNAKGPGRQRPKLASSTSFTTSSSSAVEVRPQKDKKLTRSSSDRLNELSKPPARRLSRNSETESSDVEACTKPARQKSGGHIPPPRRLSRGSFTSESDVILTQRSGTSLGGRIVRESRKPDGHRRYGDSDESIRRVSKPRRYNHQGNTSDCLSTSESEYEGDFDPNNNGKFNGRSYSYNRSPPDGEMSDEIARLSHDLARDIQLLTSKSLDDTTLTTSNTVDGCSGITASETDSLDRRTIRIDSPPSPEPRKTWNSGRTALDGLMLSNVCALSSRLCSVADNVIAKIGVLHGGSPPVDLSKSQVPLLQQTASQEMATIVNNLRRVEMQLLRADEIIDPDRKLQNLLRG